MLVIDRDHQVVCLEFVPEWEGTPTGHPFNDIFHVHIEQGRTDRRTLVNSILQVEALTSTSKVQSIMHALQEIHLVVGKYVFLLQDPVEAVAIDCVIGRFVVYEDATFILMFIE
jgi:hypothetical protein